MEGQSYLDETKPELYSSSHAVHMPLGCIGAEE